MSARWSDAPPLVWDDSHDGLTLSPDEPGLLFRGILYAVALQAAVVVLVAALFVIIVLAGRAVAAPQPLPAIYAQCVLNGHARSLSQRRARSKRLAVSVSTIQQPYLLGGWQHDNRDSYGR